MSALVLMILNHVEEIQCDTKLCDACERVKCAYKVRVCVREIKVCGEYRNELTRCVVRS